LIAENEPPPLEARDLTVAYDARPVLRSVSFVLEPKQMMAVVGPNGAGKSTLLQALLGLLSPDYGSVRVFGRPIREVRRRVAYVPQTEAVDWDFPVTVRDVVLMGRTGLRGWFGRPSAKDRDIVDQSLERVGMSKFRRRHIRQLSGGQQRRVFIARALAQEADLLLMDEPFAGVDAVTERAILGLIDELAHENRAVVIVNHDLTILHRFDRVLLLNQRVVAFGHPDHAVNDATMRATYGGRLSLLEEADAELRARKMERDGHLAHTTSR
jgi:manganese/zinc/iron transport system ATP- binding protein